MTKETIEYRVAQLDKLGRKLGAYPTKLKIRAEEGETFWLDVSEKELEEIKAVLRKG